MAAAEEGAAACSITLTEVLEALADAPQAYKVGTGAGGSGGGGSGGGFSKRKVCWFGPVSYTYGGQSFPPRWPLPGPKLQQLWLPKDLLVCSQAPKDGHSPVLALCQQPVCVVQVRNLRFAETRISRELT